MDNEKRNAIVNVVIAVLGTVLLVVYPPKALPQIIRWSLVAFFAALAINSIRQWRTQSS